MIERRASLWRRATPGAFNLKKGTVIYVRETEHGWLGMYYEEKGSGHGFALNDDDFSIWVNPEGQEVDHPHGGRARRRRRARPYP